MRERDAAPVPSLGLTPAGVAHLPRETLPALLAELHALQAAVAVRLLAPASAPPPVRLATDRGRHLTVDQAGERLGVTRRWVYAHAKELEGIRLSRRCLRIPAAAVERYLAQRRA
jgi:excisionase family DNA binding protein